MLEVGDQLENFHSLMTLLKTRGCSQRAQAWAFHLQNKTKQNKHFFFLQRNKMSDVLTWSWEVPRCSVMCQLLFRTAEKTVIDKIKSLPSAIVATVSGEADCVNNACRE